MISPDLHFERALWKKKITHIAGLDEAGRGAWCGPVAAAAVIFPASKSVLKKLHGVRDSKLMSVRQRNYWLEIIHKIAIAWQVGLANHAEIDEIGIVPATRLAMQRAIEGLNIQPDYLLIDAVKLPKIPIPQQSIIKGDQQSLSIAAASVLAKTTRDALLIEMADEYPQYGFERHKGYGTHLHRLNLTAQGPCPTHRKSFAPIKQYYLEQKMG
ncbi:MAG: ribonuclease HII [Anaerolineaceae bacterium]|nr:ribonuclease HII [Anaerolineaceae bacterium]